jgi:DNA-binding NtrC family response regulator
VVLRKVHVQKFLAKRPESRDTDLAAGVRRSLRETAEFAARDAERQLISEVLHETHGNKSQAARILQTDYKTLHLKLKALGIRARDYAP